MAGERPTGLDFITARLNDLTRGNSWGQRAAVASSVRFLEGRYLNARCDSEGVADCVRCKTMLLVNTMRDFLAETATDGGT